MKHKKINKQINYKKILLLMLLAIMILIIIGFFYKTLNSQQNQQSLIQHILTICKGTKNSNHCYDREIPKLMDAPHYISMEKLFQMTKQIQEKDTSYNFCHVLGHKISEKETKKNPSKWQEVVARCPQGLCSNGCIHGAFQERFRAESLTEKQIEQYKKELIQACQTSSLTSGLSRGSCIHALGHLFMYATQANIKKSVSLCRDFAKQASLPGYTPICYDGAFMQIFQPLETEDFALIRHINVNESNVSTFCNQFSGDEKLSCWRESWPLAYKQIIKPEGLEAFCKTLDVQQQSGCFTSLFYIIPVQFHFNTNRMKAYCLELPENLKGECLGIAAVRFIQNDYENGPIATQFCETIQENTLQNTCFSTLSEKASFIFPQNGTALKKFCSAFPKQYYNACLN